jgi:hypothetical protein
MRRKPPLVKASSSASISAMRSSRAGLAVSVKSRSSWSLRRS